MKIQGIRRFKPDALKGDPGVLEHVTFTNGHHLLRGGHPVVSGDPAVYASIAFLDLNGETYAATTDYWKGTLPTCFRVEEAGELGGPAAETATPA